MPPGIFWAMLNSSCHPNFCGASDGKLWRPPTEAVPTSARIRSTWAKSPEEFRSEPGVVSYEPSIAKINYTLKKRSSLLQR
jgi:hypothetical protein